MPTWSAFRQNLEMHAAHFLMLILIGQQFLSRNIGKPNSINTVTNFMVNVILLKNNRTQTTNCKPTLVQRTSIYLAKSRLSMLFNRERVVLLHQRIWILNTHQRGKACNINLLLTKHFCTLDKQYEKGHWLLHNVTFTAWFQTFDIPYMQPMSLHELFSLYISADIFGESFSLSKLFCHYTLFLSTSRQSWVINPCSQPLHLGFLYGKPLNHLFEKWLTKSLVFNSILLNS